MFRNLKLSAKLATNAHEAATLASKAVQTTQPANELAEMAVQLRGLVERFQINAASSGCTTAAAPQADKSMAAYAGK